MSRVIRWLRDQRERDTLLYRIAFDDRVLLALGIAVIATGWLSGIYS